MPINIIKDKIWYFIKGKMIFWLLLGSTIEQYIGLSVRVHFVSVWLMILAPILVNFCRKPLHWDKFLQNPMTTWPALIKVSERIRYTIQNTNVSFWDVSWLYIWVALMLMCRHAHQLRPHYPGLSPGSGSGNPTQALCLPYIYSQHGLVYPFYL